MTWSVILFGLFLGIALLSIIYNAGLFVAMRERFLVWHSARLLAMVAMAVIGTQLFLGEWLADPELRRGLKLFLLDVGIAVTGPFIVAYVEKDMIGPRLTFALKYSFVLVFLASAIHFLLPDLPLLNTARHLLFVGIILMIVGGLVQSWRRGSRAARFQSLAWAPILIASSIAVGHEIIWNGEWVLWGASILAALAFEVVVSAVGVSDRFMVLRRERDAAVSRERVASQVAVTDPLTGLPNRRGLDARLANPDLPTPDAVAFVDLDHFKAINDTYGHDVGDKVLVAAASALVSENSFAARVGGEEFSLLIYSDNPVAEAELVRSRITNSVNSRIDVVSSPVTASMGVYQLSESLCTDEAIRKADQALYRAKAAGRDRLVCASDSVAKPPVGNPVAEPVKKIAA